MINNLTKLLSLGAESTMFRPRAGAGRSPSCLCDSSVHRDVHQEPGVRTFSSMSNRKRF